MRNVELAEHCWSQGFLEPLEPAIKKWSLPTVIVVCLEVKLALPSYQGMACQCLLLLLLLLLPGSMSASHSCDLQLGLIPFSFLFPDSSSFHGVWRQLAELVASQPSRWRPRVNQGVWWGGMGWDQGIFRGVPG